MTEEERKQWREYKGNVVEELQRNSSVYATKFYDVLVETDKRIGDYVFSVIDNPEAHNLYEILGVRRFLKMLDKYEWKAKRVRHFFKFYETIRFSGLRGRTRYKLTPVQAYQFANIYGFARSDGRRLIRTAYLFVPRKFSKTTSCAAMAVYDMLLATTTHRLMLAQTAMIRQRYALTRYEISCLISILAKNILRLTAKRSRLKTMAVTA